MIKFEHDGMGVVHKSPPDFSGGNSNKKPQNSTVHKTTVMGTVRITIRSYGRVNKYHYDLTTSPGGGEIITGGTP